MSKKYKRIKAALQEFVESEHEKTSDMLDSIEAIHGATARAVVEQCFDMATLFMSMAEVFVLSTDIPEKAKESVVGPVHGGMWTVINTMLHLSIGAGIPKCDATACECDPRARELHKMFDALISVHVAERDRCTAILDNELKK